MVVHRLDQVVDALWWEQTGAARVARIGTDIDHPDAVVGVEHVDRVRRPHPDPPAQRAGITGVDRVEGERREHEVVDEIDVKCDPELVEVMAVHLDQDRHRTLVAGRGEAADELQRFGQHEARRACPLYCVADGIETDAGDAGGLELIEDLDQVGPAERMLDVDVDLLIGEGRPHRAVCAIGELDVGEG